MLLKGIQSDLPIVTCLPAAWQGGPGRVRREHERLDAFIEKSEVYDRLLHWVDWIKCAADALVVERRPSDEEGGRSGTGSRPPTMKPQQMALGVLVAHQDWSITDIAKAVGCDRTTLYRDETFMAAWQAARPTPRGLRRGSKGKDGSLEAEDDEQ